MKRIVLATLCMGLFLAGCESEKPAPLPELPKVELPEGIVGKYAGRLPCDNCKARMVRMEILADSSVAIEEIFVTDTATTDSLTGKFTLDSGRVVVTFPEGNRWRFEVGKSGNLALLTPKGTVYVDENGMKADLIRILKIPVKKTEQ